MKLFSDIPRPIWYFTAIWFVLGCLQAALMDLHPDEAYYWQMGRYLDWGYFHQPPMVAVFIRLGYAILENELGVRLMTILASSIGIPILFRLSGTRDHSTFILIFLGFILTHVGVFMAVPDSPLIFFTLIFLVLLKAYLRSDTVPLAVVLGIVAAALMYSKYHAVVLFASVMVAVPRLLLRRSFWLTVTIGVALFVPHILWQFEHGLISFKFHWVIRDKTGWDLGLVWNYLSVQLILLGPLGLLLAVAVFRSTASSEFNRMLRIITIGFFGFFLFLSFRGRVEANWTATALIPLIILGTNGMEAAPKLRGLFRAISLLTIATLIVGRIYILSPEAGVGLKINFPLSGWKEWAEAVKQKADGSPAVFTSSYQYASQYAFYSGDTAYHWSPANYNGNQFDLWDFDRQLDNRPFAMILGFGDDPGKAVTSGDFPAMYVHQREAYRSYRNLRFVFEEKEYAATVGEELQLQAILMNGTGADIQLDSLLQERPAMVFYYFNGTDLPSEPIVCDGCTGMLRNGDAKPVSFSVRVPEGPGKHFIRFGLEFAYGMPEQSSDFIKLTVADK